MLRTTIRIVSLRTAIPQISISSRFISNSPMRADGASKQGMGEKKPVNGDNPLSARAETAKNAAKSVASGVKGMAQKVTGGEAKPDAMDVEGKAENEQQAERGRKEGLAKKGSEQGGL